MKFFDVDFYAEFFGTAFLLAVVVGSGVMAESLAQGNPAIALLANSLATGAGLFVLIQCLAPISGAHLNPVVSLLEVVAGDLPLGRLPSYWLAQILGGLLGVFAVHAMFAQPILQVSTKLRSSANLGFSEFVATFGLIATIMLSNRKKPESTAICVAMYITAAYWFTSSTSFANPAVTIARMFTDTFCGIAPSGAPLFIAAQILGGLAAYFLLRNVNR